MVNREICACGRLDCDLRNYHVGEANHDAGLCPCGRVECTRQYAHTLEFVMAGGRI